MGREGMSQRVAGGALAPLELSNDCGDRALHGPFVKVMPADHSSARAARKSAGSDQELPARAVAVQSGSRQFIARD